MGGSMKSRFLVALAVAGLLQGFGALRVQGAAKPILVHYMPWFVAKPYSGAWGYHWTMGSTNYNPDQFLATGRRKIASNYYPLTGPYDSLDPAVLEYQVLLMKLGGVDGIIADWYGHESYLDYGEINQRTMAISGWARKAGLKFSICYEDRTVQTKVNNGRIAATGAVSNAQQSMLYLQTNYFADSSYLRLSNRPVLLNFGPVYFKTDSQWSAIFSVLSNPPAFYTEDTRYAAGLGAFNWPPMWRSVAGVLSLSSLNSYLDSFEVSSGSWPSSIGSAFPRFHDFYAQAGMTSYGYLDDRSGQTLRETLTRALTNRSHFVQVVTWNDYGEGTIVEPTLENGYRDLGIIQDLRRKHVEPGFPHGTNELSLAFRLYEQRRQFGNYPAIAAELNRIFTNLVSGRISAASRQLAGVETYHPVLYDFKGGSNTLQFAIGGYLAGGAQVAMSTNLTSWEVVRSYSSTTGLILFTTNISSQATSRYLRVQ